METSVCDQLPSTPPKLAEKYSEYDDNNSERHYRCSPLVLKASSHLSMCHLKHLPHINAKANLAEENLYNICKNIDCEFQSSFTLDDINEKISTTHNTPTDETYAKFTSSNNPNTILGSSDFPNEINNVLNNAQSVYNSEDNTTESLTNISTGVCCKENGAIFCCEEFENRIFNWIEENIPKMSKPEEKMELYFEKRRNTLLINSLPMQLRMQESIQQNEIPTMEFSQASSTSSIPPPNGLNQNDLLSKISSISSSQESQSMKIIEGVEKFGSSLFKRRQSQVMQPSTGNRLTQNKRLSIMTVTLPFNKIDEKN
ncbi:hypothetical protein TTHERM_00439340 (macronuclear) [Tetrahymena thermophila SB210]|uniref:Uncharacterized protein n=1 Tax=Tetrahymena thermophila (strain SB210) TaxID=312017 RepID=I7M1U2_TETTS|nr:hypothetical protein TTHERM_00439340 [Tetrahymena thermophila SB210]EAR97586.3 hypothetical protein TTHERM_00439340 [Tetrahymena thermophila SB210]|eukprot:XP_001017831.3 hypothetical protein TTHERM_00439340 [Tetrahymena thermophila SB210]